MLGLEAQPNMKSEEATTGSVVGGKGWKRNFNTLEIQRETMPLVWSFYGVYKARRS